MPPLVSVIVPVFNGRPFIGEALESIREQTYPTWEAIVVDDGSTDGSGELALELASEDSRIRVYRQDNRGLPAARNVAIAHARGTFVAFLDADDRWLPEKLERQVATWVEGVLYSDAYLMGGTCTGSERVGDHIEFARGQIFEALLVENVVPVLTAFLPREVLERAQGFDEKLVLGCEDYDLWLRLAADDVPFDVVPEPLASYRVHAQGMSLDSVNMTTARVAVFEGLAATTTGRRRALAERRAIQERRNLAGTLRRRAWERALGGALDDARDDLRAAQEAAPTFPARIGTTVANHSDTALRALARWRASASKA